MLYNIEQLTKIFGESVDLKMPSWHNRNPVDILFLSKCFVAPARLQCVHNPTTQIMQIIDFATVNTIFDITSKEIVQGS